MLALCHSLTHARTPYAHTYTHTILGTYAVRTSLTTANKILKRTFNTAMHRSVEESVQDRSKHTHPHRHTHTSSMPLKRTSQHRATGLPNVYTKYARRLAFTFRLSHSDTRTHTHTNTPTKRNHSQFAREFAPTSSRECIKRALSLTLCRAHSAAQYAFHTTQPSPSPSLLSRVLVIPCFVQQYNATQPIHNPLIILTCIVFVLSVRYTRQQVCGVFHGLSPFDVCVFLSVLEPSINGMCAVRRKWHAAVCECVAYLCVAVWVLRSKGCENSCESLKQTVYRSTIKSCFIQKTYFIW